MKTIILLAFCLCLFSTASAQGVKVTVSGAFGIKEQVSSNLNRHFRQFKDVTLVDADDDAYFIEVGVIVVESKAQDGGYTLGYVLSVEVREPIGDLEAWLFEQDCPKGSKAFKRYVGRDLSLDHLLYTTPPDKLDSTCQKIVAIVDTNHIEPLRKSRRQNSRKP